MGNRGPKPVDVGLLSMWEVEFYKAFHLLRDGTPFHVRYELPMGLPAAEIRRFIGQLKRMSPEQYWLTTRRVAAELQGGRIDLRRPPTRMDRWWAEGARDEETYWLERALNPLTIEAQARRRRIWDDLVRANMYAALRKACGRWARLPDVRAKGLVRFPSHILANAGQFFAMKRNKRFPTSSYGDDSRLEYLARGMAGVMVGVSPMTAIERLRNMKHGAEGGPLWSETEQRCRCWRCSSRRSNELNKAMQGGYVNGLRLFMEIAATTSRNPTFGPLANQP